MVAVPLGAATARWVAATAAAVTAAIHLLGCWWRRRCVGELLHPLLLVLQGGYRRGVSTSRCSGGARCVFGYYRERYLEAYQQRYQQALTHYRQLR